MPKLAQNLVERLKSNFDSDVRTRGDSYYHSGAVWGVEVEGNSASAFVDGGSIYQVEFEMEPGMLSATCTCPAFRKFGPCKHLWAFIRTVDADGSLETGHEKGKEKPPEWQERVGLIGYLGKEQRRNPWSALDGQGSRIEYHLLRVESFDRNCPVVQVHSRKRLQSGKWRKPTLFEVPARGERHGLSGEDRRLLGLMNVLSARTGAGYYGYYSAGEMATCRLEEKSQCDLLLPELAKTGRLIYERNELEWDDGEPWLFRLRIDEQKKECVLRSALERADEVMPIEEPEILFAHGFLIARGRVARFDHGGEMRWVADQRQRGALSFPSNARQEIERLLEKTGGRAWTSSRPEVVVAEADCTTPVPHLNLESPVSETRSLVCQVSFDYGLAERVLPEDPEEIFHVGGSAPDVRRNFEAESLALQQFLETAVRRDPQRDSSYHGTLPTANLPTVARTLIDLGWKVSAKGREFRSAGAFQAKVQSGVDWFELHGGLEFGDQVVPFPKLLAAAKERRREVTLDDGSTGLLPEDWLAQWGLLEVAGKTSGDALRFEDNQGWLLDAMLAERENVQVDADFQKYRDALRSFDGIRAQREPRGFQGELREYQRDALGWFKFLRTLGLGGCLADDMGLGKTVQVLAMLEGRRLGGKSAPNGGDNKRPTLIVAPRSLVFNWIAEAKRFAPKLTSLDYTGTDRRARLEKAGHVDLLVTTYGSLRRDAVSLSEMEFDYVVLDEATAIKNANSQSAKAARLLRARHRLALSGTPVENHIGDLWSLFEFLNPGMLGRSRAFQKFAKGGGERDDFSKLARAIRPFFLRRKKEEVLTELPGKSEQVVMCEMSKKERKRYDEVRDHYRSQLLGAGDDSFQQKKIQVLEALLRLRQCACHPALIDKALNNEESAKLEALLPRLEELCAEGHKVLVFSQFTSFLKVVRERLDKMGITYEYLDGRTRKRQKKVDRFQEDPDCPLFLISLKAGGHGLNLTAADYVFLLDPWWNPAIESQAVDRAHRMGQTRPVFAYRLIAKGTVEEKVLELQAGKRELAQAVLGDGKSVLQDLSRADLEVLLS